MEIIFLGILGLVVGSFIGSLTWRIPRKTGILGRSFCPNCKTTIAWYDNIPVFSYFLLGGKCRHCGKRISLRYPLIEATTALIFVLIGGNMLFGDNYGIWRLPYFLFLFSGLLVLAIVDLERMIIPDEIIYPFLILNSSFLILSPSPILFTHFFWAALFVGFLLFLHFVTRGRGMGLGDVKLAFLLGFIVGATSWLVFFLATIIGAAVGLILVAMGRARFGKPIPFGPFLILGAFLTFLFGGRIVDILLGV